MSEAERIAALRRRIAECALLGEPFTRDDVNFDPPLWGWVITTLGKWRKSGWLTTTRFGNGPLYHTITTAGRAALKEER